MHLKNASSFFSRKFIMKINYKYISWNYYKSLHTFLLSYQIQSMKKRKYCSRNNKRKIFLFDEFQCFVYLRTHNKNTENCVCISDCPSGCPPVWESCVWDMDLVFGHGNFWRSYQIQAKLGACLLCIKSSSGIEIQSTIPILILIKILVLKKTLRIDTEYGGYL